ncbi:uncharacterized protein LOC106159146 [Lingula anatina]|uniref:Uncharacterized protein LOC106159146 n=1 Tax=Lingula anatina TaxID=7574 RepID=A0A1S3HXP9_LINAN|nr:uncharacterized protein LOC106159146 [Lingula anatina]|eukprot:XP_013390805.1 uncharacterized protein LOC106159146 [Lingula anatina]
MSTSTSVGFGTTKVHPLRELLYELSEHLQDDDLEKLKVLAKDRLGKEYYKTHTASSFLSSLYNQFADEEDFVELLKDFVNVLRIHVDLGSVAFSNLLDEYQKQLETERVKRDKLFVGRGGYVDNIIGSLKMNEETNKTNAVCICGFGGIGKSSLATEICWQMKCRIKKVELRSKETVKEFLGNVLQVLTTKAGDTEGITGLSMTFYSEEDMASKLYSIIQMETRETILFLDDCDELMKKSKRPFLHAIDNLLKQIKNTKFKVIMTTREKLIIENELDSQQAIINHIQVSRFEGQLQEFELQPLDLPDAMKLLRQCTPKVKMTDKECRKLAKKCGCSPQALKIISGEMQCGEVAPAEMIKRLHKYSGSKFEILQLVNCCLEEMFSALHARLQKCLVRLSVFSGSFDFDAAKAIMGGNNIHDYDVQLDLHILKCHHLVEVDDYDSSFKEELVPVMYYGNRRRELRYYLHPLVQDFADQRAWDPAEKDLYPEGKQSRANIVQFCERKLCQFAKMARKTGYVALNAEIQKNLVYLNTFFVLSPSYRNVYEISDKKQFMELFYQYMIMETFEVTLKRFMFFDQQADEAKKKNHRKTYCFMTLWKASSATDLDKYSCVIESLDDIKAEVEKIHAEGEGNTASMLLYAFFRFIEGKLQLHYFKNTQKAKQALAESVDIFKRFGGKSQAHIARAISLLASAYFDEQTLESQTTALKLHTESYDILSKEVKNHHDIPQFLVNIATAEHGIYQHYRNDGDQKAAMEHWQRAADFYKKAIELNSKWNVRNFNLALHMKTYAQLHMERAIHGEKESEGSMSSRDMFAIALKWATDALEMGLKYTSIYQGYRMRFMIFRAYILQLMSKRKEEAEGDRLSYLEETRQQMIPLMQLMNGAPPSEGLELDDFEFQKIESDILPTLETLGREEEMLQAKQIIANYKEKRVSCPPLHYQEHDQQVSVEESSTGDIEQPPRKKLKRN